MKTLVVVLAILIAIGVLWWVTRPKYVPAIQSTYQGDPLAYRGDKTLVVAVYAPWASVWKVATEAELAKLDLTRYDLLLLSADDDREQIRKLGVEIVPTVFLVRDGQILKKLPNLMYLSQLE